MLDIRLLVLLLVSMTGSVFAQDPGVPVVRFSQVYTFKTNGDIAVVGDLAVSPQIYADLKARASNPARLLHELSLIDPLAEVVEGQGVVNDTRQTIRITGTLLGAARSRGDNWQYRLADAHRYELEKVTAAAVVLQSTDQLDSGVIITGRLRIEFPAGTKNIRFDGRQGKLTFQMPAPVAPAQAAGVIRMKMNLKVRTEIMSCLGKAYGNPRFSNLWVAKTVFQNTGGTPLSDLKVRFRLRQYTEWSEWKETKVVYPTQTVIEVFYPTMDPKICNLSDKTPVLMEVVWSYRRPDGKVVEDSDFRILNVVGPNAVAFSGRVNGDFRLTGSGPPPKATVGGFRSVSESADTMPCPTPLVCPSPGSTPGLAPRPLPSPLK